MKELFVATVVIKDSAGLLAALKTAHGGDTILLSSGAYAAVNVTNIHINGNVTITSQDTTYSAPPSSGVVNHTAPLLAAAEARVTAPARMKFHVVFILQPL